MCQGTFFFYASSEKNRMLACKFGEHRDNSRNSQSVFLVVIAVLFAAAVLIESRVTCIEVLGVKVFLYHPECFAKTLEVYDLPGTQETNRIYNVRVFYDTKNVIVSGAGFLLCSHIFHKISNRIAFGLEFTGILWNTTGSL